MSEASQKPPVHHLVTTPRRIFVASGEELLVVPEEAAVVIEGTLPPFCPDSLEARREMGRTVKVKAATPMEAAVVIGSWWGGVKARHQGEGELALYARAGGTWHAIKIKLDAVELPKRVGFRLNEELLLKGIEAAGSRYALRWKLEGYLSGLAPSTTSALSKSSAPASTAPAKAAPIVQPGPTIRLSDLTPTAEPPPVVNAPGELVLDPAAFLGRPLTPPATPTPTPATGAVTPPPASTSSTLPKAPAPIPAALPPHAATWTGPNHKGAAPLTVEVVENQLPEEIADLIDTMALPPGTFYSALSADCITLFLPPAALNGDPTKRLTSSVEVRRAKLPQRPQPWVCTLKVGAEEVTSKIHKEARAAVDNALVMTAKTKLEPYKKALSVFLGGP